MRVYISSTSEDLAEHRRAVHDAIANYQLDTVVWMEHHPAVPEIPVDVCLREVGTCDLYVGLFAWRYGCVPLGCTQSITELEYREAAKRKIPTLVFLLDERTAWNPRWVDKGESGERIRALRDELRNTNWVRFFTTPDHLAREVLAARIALIPRESVPKPSKRQRVPVPIPRQLVRFFQDREPELARLRQCLANEHLRMVLLCGRGGVGKTALAVKLICELLGEGNRASALSRNAIDSIVYVSLDEPRFRSLDRIVELIARTLSPKARQQLGSLWNREGLSPRARLAGLFRGPLSRERCLLVLDNFETVLGEDNRVAPEHAALQMLIEACLAQDQRTLLLVTSRRAIVLSPSAEIASIGRRVQVSLDEGLPEEHGIALLRTLDHEGRLGVRTASDAVLAQVVRHCRGVPRTLEALIAWLLQRPTVDLPGLLRNEVLFRRLLEDPAAELYASLCGDEERLVMQALSVYDQPVPTEAIRHLLPALAVEEILDRLVRDFVVRHDGGRFSLHALDRQYAYSRIPANAGAYARPTFHKSAAAFYRQERQPPDQWGDISAVEPQLQEFQHLLRADMCDEACRVLNEIDREHLATWGHAQLIVDLRTPLLDCIADRDLEGLNLGNLGCAYFEIGDVAKAAGCYEQALAIARERADRKSEGRWLGNLGLVNDRLGQTNQAVELLSRALAVARESGDHRHEGRWLGNVTRIQLRERLITRAVAVEQYLQAIAVSREQKDLRFVMISSWGLGDLLCSQSDFVGAKQAFCEALGAAQLIGDRFGSVTLLLQLARIHDCLKETERADVCRTKVREVLETTPGGASDPRVLMSLADIFAELGREDERRRLCAQALQVAHDQGDLVLERSLQVALGDLCMAARDGNTALEHYTKALRIARDAKHPGDECTVLLRRAGVLVESGRLDDATNEYEEALRVARAAGDSAMESAVLFGFAEALLHAGQAEAATGYYELALPLVAAMHDEASQIVILNRLGMACFVRKDVPRSIGYYKRALVIAREMKDREEESVMLFNTGDAYHFLGDVATAIPYYEEAFALDRISTNFKCAVNLGVAYLQLGRADAARERFEACLTLVRGALLPRPRLHPWCSAMSVALLGLGQTEEALESLRHGLEQTPTPEELYYVLQDLLVLNRVPQEIAGLTEAIALIEAALKRSAPIDP